MSRKILNIVTAPIGLIFGKKVGTLISAVALTVAGVATGNLSLIGMGLSLGASALKKSPRVSPNAMDRLSASLDINAPRKIVFGQTALATDVRYQGYTGTDQEYLHWIIAVASHQVEAISEIWFDSTKAWDSSGGVASKYSGYLTVTTRPQATTSNGIAIDSVWTADATLTGCAYVHIRFKLTGNSKKAESPFAQSVPTRITVRGKGAFLPDIREAGCDADDQTTWDWFDDASGRNPALQLIFYLVGWRINGKLAIGRGIPAERLNLDSFITAANLCDESVTLSGGGTEPRYRSDGVFSEGDDPGLVIDNLCAAMNAVLRDDGGTIGLYVLHNDLGSPVCAFTEDDIIDGDDWEQTPAVDEFYNLVRGRYPDASDTNLYQLIDYPEVEIESVDGIDRIDTFDLAMVQSSSQAQRLAKQRLQRNLYRGVFSARFNYRAWQVSLGDPVTLSHAALGWLDKPFRVAGQNISIDGTVALVLKEENEDIYAWDAEESPAVQPAEPTAYDPLKSPLIQGLVDVPEEGQTLFDDTFSPTWWTIADPAEQVSFDFSRTGWALNLPFQESTEVIVPYAGDTTRLTRTEEGQPIFARIVAYSQAYESIEDVVYGTEDVVSGSQDVVYGTLSEEADFDLEFGVDWLTETGSLIERETLGTVSPAEGAQTMVASGIAPAHGLARMWVGYPSQSGKAGGWLVYEPWLAEYEPTSESTRTIGFGPTQITIKYDYLGAAEDGELPAVQVYKLFRNGVEQTEGVSWSYSVVSGLVNGLGPSDGAQTLSGSGAVEFEVDDDDGLGTDTAVVELKAVQGAVTTLFPVKLVKDKAAAPIDTGGSGGGGGPTSIASKASGWTAISSTSFVEIGQMSGTMPSGVTTASLVANGFTLRPATGGAGTWIVEMKWQRETSPGTWADVGATATSSPNPSWVNEPPLIRYDGNISANRSDSGLTGGSAYKWRLVARLTAGSRSISITGSASVVAG